MSPRSWQERHAALIWIVSLGLACTGAWVATTMPSGIYPEVEFPRIVVVARHGDAPPEVTELALTRPLEAELATVLGVERIQARTIRGAAELALQFSASTDMWRALQLVESRAASARSHLPADVDIVVERITTTSFPVITFNLTGPVDTRRLQEIGELIVRPSLSRVSGVGGVEVLGGDRREIEVILDPVRTAALRLSPTRVAMRVKDQLVLSSVGQVERARALEHVVVASEPSLEELGRLPIATGVLGGITSLSAIAEVVEGAVDRTQLVSGPDGDTVLISVSRLPDASTPEVVAGVRAAVAALGPSLPPGTQLSPVYDQALLVEESIASVRDAILIGIVLCVLVIAVFLRDARGGLIAAMVLPITLGITFVPIARLGGSLNLMSLGGLAVAIGLVIDDSIVVIEGIRRRMELGETAAEASRSGARSLYAALLGTTATTVVVFLPLSRLDGLVGRFFSALATTISASVIISLFLSVSLIPLAAGRWLRAKPAAGTPAYVRRYERLLARIAVRPAPGLWAIVALVGLGTVATRLVGTGFLPTMDEGAIILDYFLPASTSLLETDRVARRIEEVLGGIEDIERYSRRTGSELGPAKATLLSTGDIMMRLRPGRTHSAEQIADQVRAELAQRVPEARIEIVQVLQDVLDDLAGVSRPIEIRIFGDDRPTQEALAEQVANLLREIPGIIDVYPGFEAEAPELRLSVDAGAAALLGQSPASIAEELDAALHGIIAGQLPRPGRPIEVRVRFPDADRFDEARLPLLPLWLGDRIGSVDTLARLERSGSPVSLERDNLRAVVVVTADREGRDLGSVMRDVERALASLPAREGHPIELGGQFQRQRETFFDLAAVIVLGLLAVAVVLLAQFRRPIFAVWIVACAPLALVGAVITLAATGIPLDASSLMGCVLLIGLVVKNGILLLEQVETLLQAGQPFEAALVGAGALRLRPILMTTVATIAGLLPLVLGWGSGAELQRPLAVAVVGGLAVSTFVTLVVLRRWSASADAPPGSNPKRLSFTPKWSSSTEMTRRNR